MGDWLTKVAQLTASMRFKPPFKNGVPGKDWAQEFLKRHPDISLRSQTLLSTVRSRMLNEIVTERYFDKLSEIITKLNLKEN